MLKWAVCLAILFVVLGALRSVERDPTNAQSCSLAVTREEARLRTEHSPGEARRIAPLEVAAQMPQCGHQLAS